MISEAYMAGSTWSVDVVRWTLECGRGHARSTVARHRVLCMYVTRRHALCENGFTARGRSERAPGQVMAIPGKPARDRRCDRWRVFCMGEQIAARCVDTASTHRRTRHLPVIWRRSHESNIPAITLSLRGSGRTHRRSGSCRRSPDRASGRRGASQSKSQGQGSSRYPSSGQASAGSRTSSTSDSASQGQVARRRPGLCQRRLLCWPTLRRPASASAGM